MKYGSLQKTILTSLYLISCRCVDCNKDLCTSCVAEHKRAHDTLDHRIINTVESGEDSEDQELDRYSLAFCKHHTRNVIKYFCISCDEAICRVCTILEHREHHYVYPKEALPLRRTDIQESLEKTKERIPLLKKTLSEVDEMSRRLHECHQTLAREIHHNTQVRIKALMEAEQKLLKQLSDVNISKQKVRVEACLRVVFSFHIKSFFLLRIGLFVSVVSIFICLPVSSHSSSQK